MQKYRVTAQPCLRLRKSIWGKIITCMPFGSTVELRKKVGLWCEVDYTDINSGKQYTGWCYSRYLAEIPDVPYDVGIDISRWNPMSGKVALPDFVIIRATAGSSYVDPAFGERLVLFRKLYGPRRAGKVGVYHYFRWDEPYDKQFDNLFNVYSYDTRELVAVDVEPRPGEGDSINKAYARENLKNLIKLILGVVPQDRLYIYTNRHAWNLVIGDNWRDDLISSINLWVAHYGVQSPVLPSMWSDWKIWQYTSKGSWSGFSGYIDMNYRKKEV